MTKDVIITVCGLQMAQDGDNEPIELVTTGEYFFKNNKHYLIYEEIVDGESMVSKNRIKATQDYMELTKSGATTVHMVFEAGKKNVTHYFTPYGSLVIGLDTHEVKITESEEEIILEAAYALEMNQEHTADCTIKIQVQPKGSKEFKLIQ